MTPGQGLLSDVLDALPLAVVVVDEQARITHWNRAAEVLYGHAAADVLGATFVDVLFEHDDREGASALLATARVGTPWEGDRRVRRHDGHLLVSSFRADAVGTGGVAWTATDGMDLGLAEQERSVLLSAEHAARRSSEEALGLVEAIVTSAPVGIAVFDLDLRYVRVNDAYAEISGIPAAEHVGGSVGEVVPLPSEVGADLRRVVTTGRQILGKAVTLEDPSGRRRERHFSVSYYPVRTTAGILIGAGATVVEVTEAKRLESERAALLERAEDAQRRLALLATASTVLSTTMKVDELLDRLAQVLTPGAADWCIIQARGRTVELEHVAVSHRDREAATQLAEMLRANPLNRDGTGPISRVMATGEARLLGPDTIGDALRAAAGDRGRPEMAGLFALRSSVVVPIGNRGAVDGVIVLSTDTDRQLTDDDLDLAVEIAHRASLALGNARAFQQEHQIAESLQLALLPTAVRSVEGAEFAFRYLAATDGASVGGDWYDVIPFADGTVGLVVGDVVGHDLAASSGMGQLRSAMRAFAYENQRGPGETLSRLDRLFEPLGLSYATCVLGTLDPTERTFTWSNAGHPPPLLIRSGEVSYLDDGAGPLLGVTGGAHVTEAMVEVEEGDLLVLYTDGLIERRDESMTVGLSRLAAAAGRTVEGTVDDICSQMLTALVPVGAARNDDVAILVALVTAPPAPPRHELELSADPRSVSEARRFVAEVLTATGWVAAVDTGMLLVSELATNALRYGVPPYTVSLDVSSARVEIGVSDSDITVPTVTPVDVWAESGRGLALVTSLATDWGTRRRAESKTVWFALDRTLSG